MAVLRKKKNVSFIYQARRNLISFLNYHLMRFFFVLKVIHYHNEHLQNYLDWVRFAANIFKCEWYSFGHVPKSKCDRKEKYYEVHGIDDSSNQNIEFHFPLK